MTHVGQQCTVPLKGRCAVYIRNADGVLDSYRVLKPGTHCPLVTWVHLMLRVQLGCERWFNIEYYGADSHFCHSAYVTWSHLELWSAHVPARLSHFCCRTHFVRRDVRVERSSDVTSCFHKWRKRLLKKCANGPFYMTLSHQIIEISNESQRMGRDREGDENKT